MGADNAWLMEIAGLMHGFQMICDAFVILRWEARIQVQALDMEVHVQVCHPNASNRSLTPSEPNIGLNQQQYFTLLSTTPSTKDIKVSRSFCCRDAKIGQ
jgi:hypothetical protein